MTERTRLIEKPVTASIATLTRKLQSCPPTRPVIARSRKAPPQPALWSNQNARFLSAKNGVGWMGRTAIIPSL